MTPKAKGTGVPNTVGSGQRAGVWATSQGQSLKRHILCKHVLDAWQTRGRDVVVGEPKHHNGAVGLQCPATEPRAGGVWEGAEGVTTNDSIEPEPLVVYRQQAVPQGP